MKTVLIPTKLDKICANILTEKGYQVVQDSDTDLMALCKAHPETEALVVRSEKITPEIIDLLPNLKAVVRAGAGYNTIDIKYARRKGIDVMNTPGANSNAVAEEVFAMLLAVCRHLVPADIDTRAGGWSKKKFMGHEITGKTMGIVGLGNIGQLVAKHASGFDMKLLGYDPIVSKNKAEMMGVELVSLPELFEKADFITLHIPENNETRGLINAKFFELCKPGCVIINCARCGIINEDDLRAAKANKQIFYCNDVYPADVPGPKTIADCADIMLPHLGANTHEANHTAAVRAGEELIGYFEQGITKFVVNKDIPDGLNPIYQSLANKLSVLARAMMGSSDTPINTIRCSYYGDLKPFAKWFTAPICAGLSKNFDSHQSAEEAIAMLKDNGTSLEVRDADENKHYGNSMTIDLENGSSRVSIRGTVTENNLVISRIDDFDHIYMVPKGNFLIVKYPDRTGVLAAITTALAEAGINIENIHAPHDAKSNNSLAVVYTDQPVSADVAAKIKTAVNAEISVAVTLA